jgi:hypothetical protein
MTATAERLTADIGIGGMTVRLRVPDEAFLRMVEGRYAGFPGAAESAECDFDIELIPQKRAEEASLLDGDSAADDVRVWREGGLWNLTRGDFRAEWSPAERRGRIRQSMNPYSVDCVLRIVHTLALAKQGGFLVHAASAIRNGKAFLFSGVSGAGKTTISRLAPADATLLTDEISYVRRSGANAGASSEGYVAYGTPFAGELAEPGENVQAPIATLFFLEQGPENRIEAVNSPSVAARLLLRDILFFAHDAELVDQVFASALDFVQRVPVKRLTFLPDERVWDLIQ